MTEQEFPFSEDFQYALLKLMVVDDIFLQKCTSNLKENYFNNKFLAWIFRSICNYYRDYSAAPTMNVLSNEARKHDPEKQREYFDALNKMFNMEDFDHKYVRRELTGFIRRNIFVQSYNQAANLYNARNTQDAYRIMKEKMDQLIAVDLDDDEIVDFSSITEYINEASRSMEGAVPTGIVPIDDAMHGGLTKGSLTVLLSATNTGKTMALINILYHAVRAGKKVVFIEHEDEEVPTVLRIVSRFTGIPYNKLLAKNLLNDAEKGMIQYVEEQLGRVPKQDPEKRRMMVKFMYGPDTTVEKVGEWLKLKKKEFDFDLVICDYGQFIGTDYKVNNIREKDIIVHKTLKQIGLMLDVAMLTCAQGTREGQKINRRGSDYLRMTDISECFDIVRRATNVITMNRSEDQSDRNELVYYLDKVKHGKKNIAVMCKTDYSKCITHDSDIAGGMYVVSDISPVLNDEVVLESGLNEKGSNRMP